MTFISAIAAGESTPKTKNGNGNGHHRIRRPRLTVSQRAALVAQYRRHGAMFDELTFAELADVGGFSPGTLWMATQLDIGELHDVQLDRGTIGGRYKRLNPPKPVPMLDTDAEALFGFLA